MTDSIEDFTSELKVRQLVVLRGLRGVTDLSAQERLSACVEMAGGRENLARLSGVAKRTIDNYLYKATEPKLSSAVAISDAVGVSIEWLATGRGEILSRSRDMDLLGEDDFDQYVDDVTKAYCDQKVAAFADFVLIPRYDVEAAGGFGAAVDGEPVKHMLAFRRDWLLEEGFDPEQVAAIGLRGKSQNGFINHKDVCLVDLRYTGYAGECTYVIRIDGDILIKNVQKVGSKYRIISFNKDEFPSYDIDVDQVEFAGCVGWSGGAISRPPLPPEMLAASHAQE